MTFLKTLLGQFQAKTAPFHILEMSSLLDLSQKLKKKNQDK
jgi:hypothetical protein